MATALRRHALVMRALKTSGVQNPYSLLEPKFLHPDFESSPGMLPTRVVSKRAKPKLLSDFLVCQPFRPLIVENEDEISCFMVSARWRRAIEAVEPKVHNFWPVERVYKDQVVRGYYWLITKRGISADIHMPPQLVFRSSSLVDDEVHVRSSRKSLAGHHWAISNHFIVSGTLLGMLRTFLSLGEKRDFKFHPITLVADPADA